MMKIDIFKILFVLTLVFWFVIGIYLIYSMVFGIEYFCLLMCDHEIVYGLDALLSAIVPLLLITVWIPIIPILVLYDIIYISVRKRKGLGLIRNINKNNNNA